MKKLLLLSLILSPTLKAQINVGNIFNTDSANQMNVNWRCSSEVYPNVDQLPTAEVISFKVKNNGKIKISPNIFNDGFKPKKILKLLGIQNDNGPEKQAVSVDSSACIDGLHASLKAQFAQNTKDCATKDSNICKLTEASLIEAIDEQINNSDYAKKTKDSHKLPRVLAYNNANAVDYQVYNKQITDYCEGKPYDKDLILTGGFLKQANAYSKYTNTQPGVECLDKLKKEVDLYSEKILAEHCEASTEVCDFLKGEKETIAQSFEEMKKNRQNEVDKKEAEYKLKLNSDWEKDYEASFNSMIDTAKSDQCGSFTTGIANEAKTKFMNPVTMTKLVSKNMESLFAKMDSRCQQQFIRQYIEQNTFDSVVQDGYAYRMFCQANKAKICDENRQFTADIEKNLERMLELSFGEYGKDYFREQLLACEKENVNDLNSLLTKLKGFDKKMTCAPLKQGEAKVVSAAMPTGLYANYSLKQTGPNETTAILNLNFTGEAGGSVSGKQMEDRVKTCMDNVSPYMKGGNGEQLKIKIYNPTEAATLKSNERPAQNNISVAAGSIRSNSGRYDPGVDCTTITHEVMHLLGLCDEYKENWNGAYFDVATGQAVTGSQEKVNDGTQKFVNSYNCRNVPPIPSIMKSQDEVFNRAVPKRVSCECNEPICQNFMSGAEPLQKLYKNYGFNVIDSYYRQMFCKSKAKPDISQSKYLENSKQFALLTPATESKISFNFKYASPNSVKSYDMTCDCASPQGNAEENDKDTCRAIIGRIAKSIEEDIPPKSNTTCPPGTIQKDAKWGGDPSALPPFNGTSFEVFRPRVEPAMASVLYPAQFNRIVGGACDEVATLYSMCSTYAYKTKMDTNTCEVPDECKDMSKLMGIPQ